MIIRVSKHRIKLLKIFQIIIVLIIALVMLTDCFNSAPTNASVRANSKITSTITVKIGKKSKCYQVKKGTFLLSFAVSQLNAKEKNGFITSVGSLNQNAKKSIYLMFDLNGKKSTVGAGSVRLVNGEKVRFYLEKY